MDKISKEEYIVSRFKFHNEQISKELGRRSKCNKHSTKHEWFFGCPFCREGTSWGRESRCWYVVPENFIHCFNCNYHSDPEDAVAKLDGSTRLEILKEYAGMEVLKNELDTKKVPTVRMIQDIKMPDYAISLTDLAGYTPVNEDEKMILRLLKEFLEDRKISEAPYLPEEMYVVLKKQPLYGRLLIPFMYQNRMIYYQGRALKPILNPKYLSAPNNSVDFTPMFNMDRLPHRPDLIFMTESPIDAMFAVNTVAVAGKYPNLQQLAFLREKFGVTHYQMVFVPDNPAVDETGKKTAQRAIEAGLGVFNWYKDPSIRKFKDFSRYVARTGDLLKFSDIRYMENMVCRGSDASIMYAMTSVKDFWA